MKSPANLPIVVAWFRLGGCQVIRTIILGSCVSVQGLFVRQLSDGTIAVKVGEKTFVGVPVAARVA